MQEFWGWGTEGTYKILCFPLLVHRLLVDYSSNARSFFQEGINFIECLLQYIMYIQQCNTSITKEVLGALICMLALQDELKDAVSRQQGFFQKSVITDELWQDVRISSFPGGFKSHNQWPWIFLQAALCSCSLSFLETVSSSYVHLVFTQGAIHKKIFMIS